MFRTRNPQLGLFMTLALAAFAALTAFSDVASLLCIALASGGMYLFCHRRYGRLGALLAGLVYAYSPHVLLVRGDWRELLALALLPLLLWRVDALRDKPIGLSFLPVCLLQAALLAAHASSIWLTLLAVGWVCFEMTIQHINRESSRLRARPGLIALLALLLGMAAGAPLVPMETPGIAHELVPLDVLLSPPALDSSVPPPADLPPSLGLAQWTLALLGAAAALGLYVRGYRTRHPNTFLGTAFFALAALGLLAWVQTPAYAAIAVSLACLAAANGIGLTRLPARFQSSIIALVVALPIISIIPLLAAPAGEETATDSLDLLLSLDATAGLSLLALAGALVLSLRMGPAQLPPPAYWVSLPLTRSVVIGVLAGGALALSVWLITHSFYA
ncbi:MAG: hypothetical protein OXE46_05660 [Chloroflexi bacterium]|nr:hypothetical protein [Chloroflexota bacterium]